MTGRYQKAMECPGCGLRLTFFTDNPEKAYPSRRCKRCGADLVPSPVAPEDQPGDTPRFDPTAPPDVLVFPPGAEVEFKAGKTPARVAQVGLRERGLVLYQVVWWAGTDRKEQWVSEGELTWPTATKPVRIGFRRDESCTSGGSAPG